VRAFSPDVATLSLDSPVEDGPPLLEVEDLRVEIRSARGSVTVVDGVSYSLATGQAAALVGESGAGKSISVRAVLGLLNRRKFDVTGSVRLDGVDLASLNKRDRGLHIARCASLVFQDPTRSLNPTMRVGWQVAEAMYKSEARDVPLSKAEARKRALELMREVGIADPDSRFYSYPHELSGGMRQRIVIAIALSCQPKIIFCDEPTTSLDVTTQAQIMDLLDELRERLHLSVLLVSHDLSLAASRVDDVMVMYAGRLVERLPAHAVATNARMPYSRALLRAVPGTQKSGRMPNPIPGVPPDPRNLPEGCAFHPRCDCAKQRCQEEAPKLDEVEPGHLCRCFFPLPAERSSEEPVLR
jgi:oligopeptide/dipeptide ABC transporter ATP-binding protein